jgi:processing peptidase subunit alpha
MLLKKKFTAEKTTIAAAGITDHKTFESLINENFSSLEKGKLELDPAIYTGGVYKDIIDDEMAHVSLGFRAASFFEPEMAAFAVLKSIIGDGGGFSTGGPGKGMHSRAFTKILPYGFLETVKTYNHAFNDSGVFAISLVGLEKYAEHIPDIIIKEMFDLFDLKEEELNRAKNIITREALINYQKSLSRLEDLAKNCAFFYNTPDEFGYLKKVNQVSLEDIKKALVKMLRSEFSMTVLTKKDTKIPELENIYKKIGRK